MKITFEQTNQTAYTSNITEGTKAAKSREMSRAAAYRRDDDKRMEITPFAENGKKSARDIMDMARNTDVDTQRDKMTILSNTMSTEDFAKLSEEGYDLSKVDPQEAVTILDKIKSELIKAGKNIVGYTDDISLEALAGAVGSEGLARDLAGAFANADIPLSEENVAKAAMALEAAAGLTQPTEDSISHMVAEELLPTIKNFLMAKAGTTKTAMPLANAYFGEEIKGYVTKNVAGQDGSATEMAAQIDRIIDGWNAVEGNPQITEEDVNFLLAQGLPITEESLNTYTKLRSVTFPLDMQKVAKSVAVAIADGKDAYDADLSETETLAQKAYRIFELYQSDAGAERIKDRRILEEIRLSMTVEVNHKLLESGYQIDTAPMEELVDVLKQAEELVAKSYFKDSPQSVESYRLFNTANTVIAEIPHLPAQTVPVFMERIGETTATEIYETGKELARAFREASHTYETIGTAPRADLGDRLGKAFVSVDALLQEIAYPTTPENQKAVRALAYHEMEITAQNIERVKEAEEKLLTVVHKMTPANVLKMIRDGVNPLTTDFDALNTFLDQQESGYEKEATGYAEFLHRLDKAGTITETERDGFIGVYRLLRQIDKADGAAVSGIVSTGAQLNFATLLSAIRSGKYKGMDVKVTDEVGALAEGLTSTDSISEQISRAFSDTAKELAKAAKAPEQAYTLLEKGGMPQTAENIVAATGLLENTKAVVEKLASYSSKKRDLRKALETESEFTDAYSNELLEMGEAIEQATFIAESEVDVKAHQLLHKQLHVVTAVSQTKEYYFATQMNEETAMVHLRMEDGEGQALVEITVESEKIGLLQGYLQVDGGELSGYFVGNKKDMVMNLQNHADIEFSNDGKEWSLRRVEFIYSETGKASLSTTRKSENEMVSTSQLYGIAARFLDTVAHVGDMIS